jgi:ubiquinone/menaquinone biosynthesis C-methylase UbiE
MTMETKAEMAARWNRLLKVHDPKMVIAVTKTEEEFDAGASYFYEQMKKGFSDIGMQLKGSILDFGCGVGRMEKYLSRSFDVVEGVDISEGMVKLARERNPGIKYHVSDTLACFPDKCFDFVYTRWVLQHIAPKFQEEYIRDFLRIARIGVTFDIVSLEKVGDNPGARAQVIRDKVDTVLMYSTKESMVEELLKGHQHTSSEESCMGARGWMLYFVKV